MLAKELWKVSRVEPSGRGGALCPGGPRGTAASPTVVLAPGGAIGQHDVSLFIDPQRVKRVAAAPICSHLIELLPDHIGKMYNSDFFVNVRK